MYRVLPKAGALQVAVGHTKTENVQRCDSLVVEGL